MAGWTEEAAPTYDGATLSLVAPTVPESPQSPPRRLHRTCLRRQRRLLCPTPAADKIDDDGAAARRRRLGDEGFNRLFYRASPGHVALGLAPSWAAL
jgi:hypothetical protein